MMRPGDVLHYHEITTVEKINLQKGMNFRLKPTYSVILMSVRKGAPYQDEVLENGKIIIYEGHDVNKYPGINPKQQDQPYRYSGGSLTENGKFFEAVESYKRGQTPPELVKVYEKIKAGIRSFAGFFLLKDAWQQLENNRTVFRFKLEITDYVAEDRTEMITTLDHNRMIPTAVKVAVWKRDKGKCVECGSENNLHFDHIIPYSKGGTSISEDNIQLLCMKHNLQKSAKII